MSATLPNTQQQPISWNFEEQNIWFFCFRAASDGLLPGNKAGEPSNFPVIVGFLDYELKAGRTLC